MTNPSDSGHRREWRRRRDDEARRRRRRRRITGIVAALAVALVLAGAAVGTWALVRDGGGARTAGGNARATTTTGGPVRATPLAPPAADLPGPPRDSAPATNGTDTTSPGSRTGATTQARTEPRAASSNERPVVWIQAGHAEPREPGYRDQTGAGSGPFGDEIAFTTRLADAVAGRLRAAGVDARTTPGEVTPLGAEGAAFVSLHHDAPGGRAAIAGAHAGTSENYYRGEGYGEPSPTPYPDSAPHRSATEITPAVEAASAQLAEAIARRYRPVFTPVNGAGSSFAGVASERENPRMTRYYGFFRTNAGARVIVEAGAAGSDDAFLRDTALATSAIADGITDYLRARELLT